VLFISLFIGAAGTLAQQLSERSAISIITFSPGTEELYEGFGHSAIRVYDPVNQVDWAYNYGTFDFNQPHFYLNFTRGHLLYRLAVEDFRRMRQVYAYFNRTITEQVLNLTQTQKQAVFDFLQNNALPQNAQYNYDYFYDNCATRIGDVFVESLGVDFAYDTTYVSEPNLSIRTLTDRYTSKQFPWGKLGIDLCLGIPMDHRLKNLQYMFLPDYVYLAFKHAHIWHNETWVKAVQNERVLFKAKDVTVQKTWLTPMVTFWGLAVLVVLVSIWAYRSGRRIRWFDRFLFIFIGLLGTLLFLLWVATDHKAAHDNLNLLWALPTHFIVGLMLFRKQLPRWVNWYFLLAGILGIILILIWPLVPQALNTALIPVVLILCTRCFSIIFSA